MAASLSIAASTSTAGNPNYGVFRAFVCYLYGLLLFLHGLITFLDQRDLPEGGDLTYRIERTRLESLSLGGVGKTTFAKDLFHRKTAH